MSFEAPSEQLVIRGKSESGRVTYCVTVGDVTYYLELSGDVLKPLDRFGSPSKGLPLDQGATKEGWREAKRLAKEHEAAFQAASKRIN